MAHNGVNAFCVFFHPHVSTVFAMKIATILNPKPVFIPVISLYVLNYPSLLIVLCNGADGNLFTAVNSIQYMLFMANVFCSPVELITQMAQLQLTNCMYRDN